MNHPSQPLPIAMKRSIPFFAVHLAALAGVFLVPFSWSMLALCAGLYYLRMFGITAGYHRYFSHRAYKTHRVFQFVIAWIGTMSVQKGVLWWAANHRHHHKFSDQPNDIHSPIQSGFWWSHVGWILNEKNDPVRWDQIPDLAKFPELIWLNNHFLIPPVLLAATLFAVGGWSAFIWGFCVSTVALWHGTFTINSLSHVFGSRRYQTTDTSRNNFWLALITLGEGWHNNHHTYMSSANQGFFWWEVDGSFYLLKTLSWIGVTHDLRKPPLKLLESKRIQPSRFARRSLLKMEKLVKSAS
ncbi:MAG: fatty acid desaturase [Methylotenera sp.]|nr:fatty acid desaturase [Oligoflexia bacterium]